MTSSIQLPEDLPCWVPTPIRRRNYIFNPLISPYCIVTISRWHLEMDFAALGTGLKLRL